MIVITGALGFIGSCLARYLYKEGFTDLVLVDDFSRTDKLVNVADMPATQHVGRDNLQNWLEENGMGVDAIFHLGARTDTIETRTEIFERLNVAYSKMLWRFCTENNASFIYASSAATYGSGEKGFLDTTPPAQLKPLNAYGVSKNDFDQWALQQTKAPDFWVGFKFFNVYGPNEHHKGRMASVMFHFFKQINDTGKVRLFQSHRDGIAHGEQKRDFIYVKDLLKVMRHAYHNRNTLPRGLYNLGTGQARSYNDLARAMFHAMMLPENIEYIPMPEDLRAQYQYLTEANMSRLRAAGYTEPFFSLEDGVTDYVRDYLMRDRDFDGSTDLY